MIENKNTQSSKEELGQFFTPTNIANELLNNTFIDSFPIVEPSFGDGSSFLNSLALKYPTQSIIGLELDSNFFDQAIPLNNMSLMNSNFYDWMPTFNQPITFVGNPPYRTPAFSLNTHKSHIQKLMKYYDIKGIKEEAIFFILHSLFILDSNNINGKIHYIIPTSIIKNSVKYYTTFKKFLLTKCHINSIVSLSKNSFDNVAQDLIYISFETSSDRNIQKTVSVDGIEINTLDFFCLNENSIPFQKIFTKTFLGSVPCESLLMSVSGESLLHFKNRLSTFINIHNPNNQQIFDGLTFNNKAHLKLLSKNINSNEFLPDADDKINQIKNYISQIQSLTDLSPFDDLNNYKPIQCRNEVKYYFRYKPLKKLKFVYELNPNPCNSFFFTGNPSHSSTDYFGFTKYDVNRNASPGACRTVPIDRNLSFISNDFKTYWTNNTSLPIEFIFDYIIFISKSNWYKSMKINNKRFYFGLPLTFDNNFCPNHSPMLFDYL